MTEMNRAQRREASKMLARKARAGLLPPQRCPLCGASLRDETVPRDQEWARLQFSMALSVTFEDGKFYVCPFCNGRMAPVLR